MTGGLPGKCWAAGQPVMLKDLGNSYFKRREAMTVGLTSATVIPHFGGNDLTGADGILDRLTVAISLALALDEFLPNSVSDAYLLGKFSLKEGEQGDHVRL